MLLRALFCLVQSSDSWRLTNILEHFISPKGFFYDPKHMERIVHMPRHPDSFILTYHRIRWLFRLNFRLKKHKVSMHWPQQQRAQSLPVGGPCTVPNTNVPIFKITDQPGCGGRYRNVCVLVRQPNSFQFRKYNSEDLNADKTAKLQQSLTAPRARQIWQGEQELPSCHLSVYFDLS